MRPSFIVHEIGIGLRRNLIMTLAMVITTAVSLGFLGTAILFNQQVSVMKDFWYDNVTADQMPESFRVKLVDPEQFPIIASAFIGRAGVEQVQDQKALLERFFKVLKWVQWFAFGLALLMVVVSVILIVNTIRVAAFSRRRETGIMKLVGASSFSIQLPFLLEGAIAGFLGAALATGSFILIKSVLVDQILEPNFPITRFITWSDVWLASAMVFVIGVALAAIASFLTLMKYLRV